MKRIFLSLGFSGRKEEDVRNDIDKAKKLISLDFKNEEIEFVHNYDYIGNNRIECLGEAIKKISTCDCVYFIDNWWKHKGCVIEYEVCKNYEIPIKSIFI